MGGESRDLMSETEVRRFAGLAFVACMFIGAGIGLAFKRPDVGGAIGMGVGFLLMGFLRLRGIRVREAITLPTKLPNIVLSLAGSLLIAWGACLIFYPSVVYPYLAGISAIIIGLLLVAVGLAGLGKRRPPTQ